MKIRVKWKGSQNQRRALTIQIEPDATVDDVKREILARCLGTLEHHLEDDDAAVLQHNMVLSLNGKEDGRLVESCSDHGDEQQRRLKDFGVCSGDLIWVMGDDAGILNYDMEGEMRNRNNYIENNGQGDPTQKQQASAQTDRTSARTDDEDKQELPGTNYSNDLDGEDTFVMQRSFMEMCHVYVRKMKNASTTRRIRDQHASDAPSMSHTSRDAVVVLLVHAAMVDTGFELMAEQYRKGTTPQHMVSALFDTSACHVMPSVYRMSYNLMWNTDTEGKEHVGSCTVMCSRMGSNMLLSASVTVDERGEHHRASVTQCHRSMTLDISNFVERFAEKNRNDNRNNSSHHTTPKDNITNPNSNISASFIEVIPGVYVPREVLLGTWNQVKDRICLPIMSDILQGAGLGNALINTLIMMPMDIKRMICTHISHVEVASLACTCREMEHVCMDDGIWCTLLRQMFGSEEDTVIWTIQKRGYRAAFRNLLLEKRLREKEDARRRAASVSRSVGPSHGPPPWYPRPPDGHMRPGITGGDYDRLPGVFPGAPFGGGGRWRLGGSRQWRLG